MIGVHNKVEPKEFRKISLGKPAIVFLQSSCCTCSSVLPVTQWTYISITTFQLINQSLINWHLPFCHQLQIEQSWREAVW